MLNGFLLLKIIVLHKASLIIRGLHQIKGAYYTCTYSPIIERKSFKLTYYYCINIYKQDLRHIDIKAAYLNVNLDEKVYVQIQIDDKKKKKKTSINGKSE